MRILDFPSSEQVERAIDQRGYRAADELPGKVMPLTAPVQAETQARNDGELAGGEVTGPSEPG
jgi:hypothetical protein